MDEKEKNIPEEMPEIDTVSGDNEGNNENTPICDNVRTHDLTIRGR